MSPQYTREGGFLEGLRLLHSAVTFQEKSESESCVCCSKSNKRSCLSAPPENKSLLFTEVTGRGVGL